MGPLVGSQAPCGREEGAPAVDVGVAHPPAGPLGGASPVTGKWTFQQCDGLAMWGARQGKLQIVTLNLQADGDVLTGGNHPAECIQYGENFA